MIEHEFHNGLGSNGTHRQHGMCVRRGNFEWRASPYRHRLLDTLRVSRDACYCRCICFGRPPLRCTTFPAVSMPSLHRHVHKDSDYWQRHLAALETRLMPSAPAIFRVASSPSPWSGHNSQVTQRNDCAGSLNYDPPCYRLIRGSLACHWRRYERLRVRAICSEEHSH